MSMAPIRFLALVLAVCVVAAPGPARAGGFLGTYEDLPLAPGLTEIEGAGVSFDSPNGRIVEAYARGKVAVAEILRFYAATLPQLGWTRESDVVYRREAEVLRLGPATDRGGVTIHFAVSPE
ncbi:hypothetical protein [Magnetospirillum molischianum]|nr:hypothetical protein [Magnetospirillum molischianum]